MIELQPWMDDAACKDEPQETFFPPSEGTPKDQPNHPMWARGKAICQACPVRAECLAYALLNEDYGLWGGRTSRERRQIRRQQAVNLNKRPVHYVRSTRNKGT